MAEAHDPLAAGQHPGDVGVGIAGPLDRLEHLQDARRRAPVKRSGEGADRAAERGRDVGAGRRDHAGGEGRGVHPVLGRGDPVGVDRGRARGIRLTAPGQQEPLGERPPRVDCGLRHRRRLAAARRLRDEHRRYRRDPGELLAYVGDLHVDQRRQAPSRGQGRDRRLQVDPGVAGAQR